MLKLVLFVYCAVSSTFIEDGSGDVDTVRLPISLEVPVGLGMKVLDGLPKVRCRKKRNCSIKNDHGFDVEKYDPVCGSNQITYLNLCQLANDACPKPGNKTERIKVDSIGYCDDITKCRRDQLESAKLTSQVRSDYIRL